MHRAPRGSRRGGLTRAARRAAEERGEGLIVTLAGVVVFLVLLLAATHILLNLYARSLVSTAAFDAARIAAGADSHSAGQAEQHVHQLLGGTVEGVSVSIGEQNVTVEVRASGPSLTFLGTSDLGLSSITQTATVRRERFLD